jgi:N-acetylglucosaminyl-diphospho-decaprenol L-rhamnosyltransferase
MIDLAIIIVSFNTEALLRDCLRALPDACAGISYETYVVDNVSADRSAEMVRAEFPDVHLTVAPSNLGFARANNLALARPEVRESRYVLLLNPDTEAKPDSLATLVRFMDSHADAGACGPKLLNSNGSIQRNGAKFPTLLREFVGVTGLRRIAMRRYELALGYGREDFDKTVEVDQVSGACLMVRGDVLERVGPLDERFFMFYEEIEWCWRIKRAVCAVYYVPDAVVTHHWMGSVKQHSKRMTDQLFRSQLLYYQKTSGPLTVLGIRGVMMLGILKNQLLHLGVAAKRGLRAIGLLPNRT